jgi:hypothetical protein
MSRCSDQVRVKAALGVLALATTLSACSDIYYDRRETVLFGAEDAVATNRILQTANPWPPLAANRRLTYDGAVMAIAVERYRTGNVIPPRGNGTSSVQYQPAPPPLTAPALPVITAPVAPVSR